MTVTPDDRQPFHPGAPTGCDGIRGTDHCLGHFGGGLTTEVHAVVDGQGVPSRLSVPAGQVADDPVDHFNTGTILLADKEYDADRIRASLREKGRPPIFRPTPTGSQSPTSTHGSTESGT